MLKDAREGFSADPKPIPNQNAIFPKHCTPKPAQKPLDASKKLPQAFQKPPKGVPEGRQKAPQRLQNHPSNPCREFGQNWNRNPPNFGRPKIALALRFPLFFHFSRTCFAHPFWNLPAPFLDPFLGLPVFRFKCR